jgi:hypothetical protein
MGLLMIIQMGCFFNQFPYQISLLALNKLKEKYENFHFPKKNLNIKKNSYSSNFLGGMLRRLEIYSYFTCYLKLMDMTVP